MRQLKFCTCGVDKYRTFSSLYLGVGIASHLCAALLVIEIPGWASIILLSLLIITDIIWGYDFYSQARYLKHSKSCARRYAFIAAVDVNKWHASEYGYLSGYKSRMRKRIQKLRKRLGRRFS